MDDALKTALWNVVFNRVLGGIQLPHTGRDDDDVDCLHKEIWSKFLNHSADEMPPSRSEFVADVRRWFRNAEWHQVYGLVEFIAQVGGNVYDKYGEVCFRVSELGQEPLGGPLDTEAFKEEINRVLVHEQSGYRFVGDEIAPITNELEAKAIEEALDVAEKQHLAGVNEHLQSALQKLSDRPYPDYRNSVKESISAVESICKIVSGCPRATLPDTIKGLSVKGITLHKALEQGIIKIYAWTSDADGIRHGMTDQSTCDFDEAKYMLVSCSAFVNYLIGKATKAGLLKP